MGTFRIPNEHVCILSGKEIQKRKKKGQCDNQLKRYVEIMD